jgi:hypothetical protein
MLQLAKSAIVFVRLAVAPSCGFIFSKKNCAKILFPQFFEVVVVIVVWPGMSADVFLAHFARVGGNINVECNNHN